MNRFVNFAGRVLDLSKIKSITATGVICYRNEKWTWHNPRFYDVASLVREWEKWQAHERAEATLKTPEQALEDDLGVRIIPMSRNSGLPSDRRERYCAKHLASGRCLYSPFWRGTCYETFYSVDEAIAAVRACPPDVIAPSPSPLTPEHVEKKYGVEIQASRSRPGLFLVRQDYRRHPAVLTLTLSTNDRWRFWSGQAHIRYFPSREAAAAYLDANPPEWSEAETKPSTMTIPAPELVAMREVVGAAREMLSRVVWGTRFPNIGNLQLAVERLDALTKGASDANA